MKLNGSPPRMAEVSHAAAPSAPDALKRPWTIVRGVAYDLSEFVAKHPGGEHMVRQALGRDATGLFESYHMRGEVAAAMLARLPRLAALPATPDDGPFPNDSALYRRIRERVRKEVLRDGKRSQRGGLEALIAIDVAVTVAVYALYVASNSLWAGALMGLVGAHIGMTLNHCANHGGLTKNPTVNFWMGFANDLIGGSSLVWNYHHHVSHHIHVNSIHRDQDVFSAMPFIRFDARLGKKWFHVYQHIYIGFLFPFLFVQKHMSDIKALLKGRTKAVELIGATQIDYSLAYAAKAVHFALLLGVPLAVHGLAFLPSYLAFAMVGSCVLAWLFAISHNLAEAKTTPDVQNDWAVAQICHSANYGGAFEGLLTGGLNLQIEHHLFPACSYVLYPAIVPIVRDECRKAGVRYNEYSNVFTMIGSFVNFMKLVGEAD